MADPCVYCYANGLPACDHDLKPLPALCSAGECTRPAVIMVRLIPRPHKPFNEAVDMRACSPCLTSVKELGLVLKQIAIVGD